MVAPTSGSSALLVFSIFLAFLNLRVVEGDEDRESCPTGAIIDLTSARRNATGFVTSAGLFFPQKLTSTVDGALRGCACDVKPCLAICPPRSDDGKTLVASENHVNHSKISAIYKEEDDISPKERFHILVWHPCAGSPVYALEPQEYPEDEFYLLKNGSIFQPQTNGSQITDFRSYCLDHLYDYPTYHPHICSGPGDVPGASKLEHLKYISGLVGAVFLIATVIVYSILPELRNIHGTILRCYLCCLIVAFITVAVAWIPRIYSPNITSDLCTSGFIIYSSFMASFFWSNVLGCDMWLKLGGFGNTSVFNAEQQRKRFIGYSIYAWGMSILMTSICLGMAFTEFASENVIQPGFRKGTCWFESTTSLVAYFYGPITVILLVNICFFILSTINVLKLRRQTQEYNTINSPSGAEGTRHAQHKYWFVLIVKLFIVMGISWIMEIISWLAGGPGYIWLLTDLINALQGVFIFIVFVCKKSIWRSLRKRFTRRREEDSNSAMANDQTCMSLNAIPEPRINVPETS